MDQPAAQQGSVGSFSEGLLTSEGLQYQVGCLNLLTNAIILWNSVLSLRGILFRATPSENSASQPNCSIGACFKAAG